MRSQGHAVETVCRVLRELGCPAVARTYRAWRSAHRRVAARTISDAVVLDAVRSSAWCTDEAGVRRLTPEGLYGRRKMTALLRRTSVPDASPGAVDRAMRALALSGVRRDKHPRTTIPAKDGIRARDLPNRDFTAPAPNRVWVTDYTYVRTWAGWVHVAFIVDRFSQKIVSWHASTSQQTDLVMVPLRIASWQRDRDGHPLVPGELIHHPDAGPQHTSLRLSEHLALEGIRPSIGTVGDAYDNRLLETSDGLGKAECVHTTVFHAGPYTTITDVQFATAARGEWYNNRRLHGSLGHTPPAKHEATHYAAPTQQFQPA